MATNAKCRVDTIVITEQPVVLYGAFIKKHGVPQSIVFNFPRAKATGSLSRSDTMQAGRFRSVLSK
jgi:hypothetical protein